MDDQNDSDDMIDQAYGRSTVQVGNLLKALKGYNDRHCSQSWHLFGIELFSDESGSVFGPSKSRKSFGTIAECLDILSR